MKNHKIKNATSVLLAAAFTLVAFTSTNSVHAQGSLTPPGGAPVPVMKTLDQVEARTPISSAPYTITNPGSYYLTGNLSVTTNSAIIINTNQVTLDLNGFTISSTSLPGTGSGISLNQPAGNIDITIMNGHIKGSSTNSAAGVFNAAGFYAGIDWPNNAPQNIRVVGVSVSGCYYGMYLGNSPIAAGNASIAESCTVKTASIGIVADIISHCAARDCSNTALLGVNVSDSRGDAVASGTAINGSLVNGCYAYAVSGFAIAARIANACSIVSGTSNIVYKYNMP